MTKFLSLLAACAAALVFAGCAEVTPLTNPVDPESNAPVKIGVILPLTGPEEDYGQRTLNGIQFACDALNNGRGISGRRVELLVRNNESNPLVARRQATELANAGVSGLIAGYDTDEVLAIKDVAERRLIPTMVPLATADEITSNTKMIYRNCFTDSQQGEMLAAYAWYWRKLLRLGIVVNNTDTGNYSRNVARAAAQAFTDFGGTVVGSAKYNGNDREFIQSLRELVQNAPQAILVPGDTANSGKVVKLIREYGYQGLLLGPDSWDENEFLRQCGPQPGDCAFVGLYSGEYDLPEQLEFRNAYRKANYVYPGACEAQGYDALNLLAIGLGRATSVEEFTLNMQQIRRQPTAAGLISMLPGGGVDRTMFIKRLRPADRPGQLPSVRLSIPVTMKKLQELREDDK